jgi:exodeoxyribonuclease VII small subunit
VKPSKAASGIKFEVALTELEKIVGEMESAELPLEKLIERYEDGMRLVKICNDKLSDAEQKIAVITQNKPILDSENKPNTEEEKSDDEDASDVRLF